jgi:exopolysaccharide biosynthesis polyprenyl glycosylphosphotransferase
LSATIPSQPADPAHAVPIAALPLRAIAGRSWAASLLDTEWRRLLAVCGQIATVAVPVLVFERPLRDHPVGGLVLALVIATWCCALRYAFRVTHRALGPGIAAACGTAFGFLLVSGLALWIPAPRLAELPLLRAAAAITLTTATWEAVTRRWLTRRQKVLILGAGAGAGAILDEAERRPRPTFEVLGLVAEERSDDSPAATILGTIDDLTDLVDAVRPDLVVLANSDPGPAVDRLLESSWRAFRVVGLSHFFEHSCGRVPLAHIDSGWFLSILHVRQPNYSRGAKRMFDLVVGTLVLIVAAPVIAVIVLALAATGGPVIYRQIRVGERGRRFQMYKFRTMSVAAELGGGAQWASRGDPRVTHIGHVLRRTRADELPQLWNVLRGDMSLVGPRPERPEFVSLIEASVPYWSRRLLVKPGLTGWAQLHSGYADSCATTADKLSYDLWYMRHRTLLLDVAICARTLLTIVSGAGAR